MTIENNQEYILCAAWWFKDIPVVRKLENNVRPFNCDRGIVFSGWRHPQCLYQMVSLTGLPQHETGENIEGFLTSKNRFVDRKEGAEIAIKAKQIIDNPRHSFNQNKLYSEDLYLL